MSRSRSTAKQWSPMCSRFTPEKEELPVQTIRIKYLYITFHKFSVFFLWYTLILLQYFFADHKQTLSRCAAGPCNRGKILPSCHCRLTVPPFHFYGWWTAKMYISRQSQSRSSLFGTQLIKHVIIQALSTRIIIVSVHALVAFIRLNPA